MYVLLLCLLRTLEKNHCNYDNMRESKLNLATPGTQYSVSF
jgi:hypothetical protein